MLVRAQRVHLSAQRIEPPHRVDGREVDVVGRDRGDTPRGVAHLMLQLTITAV